MQHLQPLNYRWVGELCSGAIYSLSIRLPTTTPKKWFSLGGNVMRHFLETPRAMIYLLNLQRAPLKRAIPTNAIFFKTRSRLPYFPITSMSFPFLHTFGILHCPPGKKYQPLEQFKMPIFELDKNKPTHVNLQKNLV